MRPIIAAISRASELHIRPRFKRFLPLMFVSAALFSQAATQTIPLKQGGNYIGFTLTPADPTPSAVFATLGTAFVQASTMDNASKKWTFFRNRNKSATPTDIDTTNALDPMPNVAMGRGYYVEMSAAAVLTVDGAMPTAIQPITLQPGQNFVCPVIPGLTAPIGLSDLMNGPDYNLNSAHLLNGALHVQFTNNGAADDTASSLQPGEALFIESTSATPVTFTPALLHPPLVYFENASPIVVESPITGAGGTSTVNVPIRFSRQAPSQIKFVVTGSAYQGPTGDFSFPSLTTTDNVGTLPVPSGATSATLPITINQKPRLQNNANLTLTLRRPAEPGITDSASLPQVQQIKITDGLKGIYEGVIKNQSNNPTLEGQNFRIALRANGSAVFQPADGGAISARFSLPYTLDANGAPQLSGFTTVTLDTQTALSRVVSIRIAPGTSVAVAGNAGDPPAYDVPLTLTYTNLVGSGPLQVSAKITITQADPAL